MPTVFNENRTDSYFCTCTTKEEVQEIRSEIRKRIANGEPVCGFKNELVTIKAMARGPRKGNGGCQSYALHDFATHFDVYVYKYVDYRNW